MIIYSNCFKKIVNHALPRGFMHAITIGSSVFILWDCHSINHHIDAERSESLFQDERSKMSFAEKRARMDKLPIPNYAQEDTLQDDPEDSFQDDPENASLDNPEDAPLDLLAVGIEELLQHTQALTTLLNGVVYEEQQGLNPENSWKNFLYNLSNCCTCGWRPIAAAASLLTGLGCSTMAWWYASKALPIPAYYNMLENRAPTGVIDDPAGILDKVIQNISDTMVKGRISLNAVSANLSQLKIKADPDTLAKIQQRCCEKCYSLVNFLTQASKEQWQMGGITQCRSAGQYDRNIHVVVGYPEAHQQELIEHCIKELDSSEMQILNYNVADAKDIDSYDLLYRCHAATQRALEYTGIANYTTAQQLTWGAIIAGTSLAVIGGHWIWKQYNKIKHRNKRLKSVKDRIDDLLQAITKQQQNKIYRISPLIDRLSELDALLTMLMDLDLGRVQIDIANFDGVIAQWNRSIKALEGYEIPTNSTLSHYTIPFRETLNKLKIEQKLDKLKKSLSRRLKKHSFTV